MSTPMKQHFPVPLKDEKNINATRVTIQKMINQFTLKNGLKVVTYSIPQMRSVFMAISVKGGSVFDTPKTSGAAHFMEHILVQAIPSFPTVELLAAFMESLAGSYNASTSFSTVRFNAAAPALYIEDLLKISGEVFYEPLFKEDDIERERGAVLQEVAQRQDALWYKNGKFFKETRYKKNHPMLLDPGGTKESVEKITKEDLVGYWKKFFDPKNSYMVVVGGFDADKIETQISDVFKKYPARHGFAGFPKLTNADFTGRETAIRFDKELQTCYIDIAFPAVTANASIKDRTIYRMSRAILGNLHTSRLFTQLRQRRGLVYDVGFGAGSFEDYGYGSINSQVSPDKLDEVTSIIVTELKNFRDNGPTEAELSNAKNFSKNQALMQFDHPYGIAGWIEGDLLWEEKIYTPEEYVEVIESVTKDDLIEQMQSQWDLARMNFIVQGPLEDSKKNKDHLAKLVDELK